MNKMLRYALPALLAVALVGCEGYGPKQTGGTVLGGAAGGLLGSQIGSGSGRLAATAAGVLLGALAGSSVGQSLDRADQTYAARSTQTALERAPSGSATSWTNPDSGHSGTVTPVRTYQTPAGQNCREYQQTVTVGGQTQSAYGTACRQADGSWKIVN